MRWWPFSRERFTADLTHLRPWMRIEDGGQVLRFADWGWPRPRDHDVGDFVILNNNGTETGRTTRYRITAWSRPCDPGDQFIASAVYAPRRVE